VAVELQASLILIDEQRGRRVAAARSGIHGVAGSIVGSEGARSYSRMQADT
jgi:hypothetical protein